VSDYEQLKLEVRRLFGPDYRLSDEERSDWAYGQARLSNPDVTRAMVEVGLSP
jgi:hypothetical protein